MLDGDGVDFLVANLIYKIDPKVLDKSHYVVGGFNERNFQKLCSRENGLLQLSFINYSTYDLYFLHH